MRKLLLLTIFLWGQTFAILDPNKIDKLAVVIVPVADGITSPLQLYDTKTPINELYANLPFAKEKGCFSCPRFHQLLFNEVVKVNQQRDEEIECEFFNVFYQNKDKKNIRNLWTQKKNIKLLSEISSHNLFAIPEPYKDDPKKCLKNILTIYFPWHDNITNTTYSAGTRFTRASKFDSPTTYAINLLDPKSLEIRLAQVPRKIAIVNYPKEKASCIRSFVNILKKWTNQKDFVPYVWGGCSFIKTYTRNNFTFVEEEKSGEKISYYSRPDDSVPHTGIECSALIFRAAQICAMPYFYKNTTTIATNLEKLNAKDRLNEGDLIWYPGHVLIVSDVKKNLVIESVGYQTKFGYLHEIPISLVFKNIKNYQQLIDYHKNNKTLERIDKDKKVMRVLPNFLLLKMQSIWK